PFRFALVEHGVYRGGYPRPRNLAFLHQLKFRTLVSLTPDPLPASIPTALSHSPTSNIQCLHIHVPKPKEDQVPLDAVLALKIITSLVLDPGRHPMYIHCLDGQLVTGSLILALRKVQGWSVQSAMAEFQ
ncbi:protein-tyrosine phosphatase, partial [Catenaria anguillulae PL171]